VISFIPVLIEFRNDFSRFKLLTLAAKAGVTGLETLLPRFIETLSGGELLTSRWQCSLRPLGELFGHFQHLWPHISPSREKKPKWTEKATAEVRYEAYRALCNEEGRIDCEEVLHSVSHDLIGCEQERHIEFILLLLIRTVGSQLHEHAIDSKVISSVLENTVWTRLRRDGNRLNLIRLWWCLHKGEEALLPIFHAFIREKLRDTDEYVRLQAVSLLGEFVHDHKKHPFDEALYDSALLLKDEISEIRESASELCTPFLLDQVPSLSKMGCSLNSEICWSLALGRWYGLCDSIRGENPHLSHDSDPEEFFLFEACARNSFAEDFQLFEHSLVVGDISLLLNGELVENDGNS